MKRIAEFLAVVAIGIWGCGCTTMSERYKITEVDGSTIEYSSRVMALGNGAAEFVSSGDGTTAFATEGKGISDNAKESLGEISEGAVRGMKSGL